MEKKCQKIQKRIPELLADALPAEQAAELHEHIDKCADCRRYLEDLRADDQMLGKFVESMKPAVERIQDEVIKTLSSQTGKSGAPFFRRGPYLLRYKTTKFAVAAAIILVGIFFLFDIPSVNAITLAQISEAIKKVKNICISRISPREEQPWQERWVSQTHGFRLLRNRKDYILWDYTNKVYKLKSSNSETIQEKNLSPDALEEVRKSIEGSFGMVPFRDISAAPKGARWDRVDDEKVTSIVPGTEVYDLTWNITKGTIKIYYKWRAFVDKQTNYPLRAEWYDKDEENQEYQLRTIEVITYPTDDEIKAVLQKVFGQSVDNN